MQIIVVFALLLSVALADISTTARAIPGGKVDVDPTTDAAKDVVKFAYTLIHDSINSAHALKLGKVVKMQSQVVSGVKYYVTIEVNETDCARSEKDLDNCKVIKTEVCDAIVLSRPWDPLHKRQLLSYSCK